MFHMLRPDEPCLLKTLKDEGYYVWWGGKNDLVPAQHGFDDYCDVKYVPETPPRPMFAMDRAAEWRGDPESDTFYSFHTGKLETGDEEIYRDSDWANVLGAIDLIRSYDGEKPLCIYLPLTYPHPPYAVEEPWYSMIDREALPPRVPAPDSWDEKPSLLHHLSERQRLATWDEPRWNELRATYLGMCARVDHQFGLLLEALREAGMYDDTAIFMFSDHGDFTGDYGLVEKTQNTFEDCLTNVPLMVKPPMGYKVTPRVVDGLVELIDVPATVEAICGITPDHSHFGQSLLPMIAGETNEGRDAVFCEGGRREGEDQASEAASPGASDPMNLYAPRISAQITSHVKHSKAIMCRTRTHKYVRRLYETDELYDLVADPDELHNLIHDPDQAAVRAKLKDRLLTHLLDTSDVVPFDLDLRHA
jgi:arylsulfatase A-like enzyme